MELSTQYSECELNLLSHNFVQLKLTLQKFPELFTYSQSGETLLHLACDNNEFNIVKFLLKNHSNPNTQNMIGETPLHVSVFRGYTKIVLILLSFKADPNIKTFDQKSVFDYALEFKENSIFLALQNHNIPDSVSLNTEDYNLSVSASNETVIFYSEANEVHKVLTSKNQGVIVEETSVFDEINSPVMHPRHFLSRVSFTQERLKTKKVNFKEELFDFLDKICMRQYFKLLTSNGFDHFHGILTQMKTKEPVNHLILKKIGMEKPGDRSRIVVALEKVALEIRMKEIYKDFEELMEEIGLDIYFLEFKRVGLDSLELLVENAFNAAMINDDFLKNKLRMKKIGHRMRFLAVIQYLSLNRKTNCNIF